MHVDKIIIFFILLELDLRAWADVYFRTKWRLHPSSRLATINMGQKLGGGGCALCSGGSLVPIEHSRLGRGLPPYQVAS